MPSSILNESYFYCGYVYFYDFGREFSECSMNMTAQWYPIDTIDAKPQIIVIDHNVVVYGGVHDHTGWVENTGPGLLRLNIVNYCPCGRVNSDWVDMVINPTIVEDPELFFPRRSGFIQFARNESCNPNPIPWVIDVVSGQIPTVIQSYNHLIITAGIELVRYDPDPIYLPGENIINIENIYLDIINNTENNVEIINIENITNNFYNYITETNITINNITIETNNCFVFPQNPLWSTEEATFVITSENCAPVHAFEIYGGVRGLLCEIDVTWSGEFISENGSTYETPPFEYEPLESGIVRVFSDGINQVPFGVIEMTPTITHASSGWTGVLEPLHLIITCGGESGSSGSCEAAVLIGEEMAKLQASDKEAYANFGYSVSISSDGRVALIGASDEDTDGPEDAGAAYVFVESGGTWTQQAKLQASDKEAYDHFGYSVSISAGGAVALIGDPYEDTDGYGAAYVFVESGGTWTQQSKLQASDKEAYDYFGNSVSISSDGRVALIGAPYESTVGSMGAGSAYVFI